jgi:nucleoside-diphosphate-sugar epimerase
MQGDRYLVTGCAGFIAANVCRRLLESGHSVVGIDNLSPAYDPRLKEWRLAQLQGHPRFSFEPLDITDRGSLAGLFSSGARTGGGPPFAAVLNLAARAGVRPSVADPWIYFETNTTGTLNLLEACRGHGVTKLVLASTSSAYGDANPVPFAEDADTSRPLSPYAASKKAAETLTYTYHYLHGLDVTVLRYFTVYGPAGRPDMSIFRFIRRIAEGSPITVYGDGSQERDFTYVDDIARGTVAALRPLGYEVINLGGDRPVRLSAVIDEIAHLTGRVPRIEYRPAHRADVRATWADIGKAGRLLDWRPEVGLAEGLARSVEWYRQHRELALALAESTD